MSLQQYKDSAIRHAVLLEQLKKGEINDLQRYYRELDRTIRELLSREELLNLTAKQYQQFLKEAEKELQSILKTMSNSIESKLHDITQYEADFELKNLKNSYEYKFNNYSSSALLAALSVKPIQTKGTIAGQTLEQVVKSIPSQAARIVNTIKVQVAQGENNNEIIKAIRGTKALKYTDGELNTVKNNIDSTYRTLISHSSTVAKESVYQSNTTTIKYVQWVSVLDARTTSTCASLDGRLFPADEGPRPPLHYNCRSIIIPYVGAANSRASQTGQVEGDPSYYEWLEQQNPRFQDQALGSTRGKLFRDGGLNREEFARLMVNQNYQPITLDRMRELEPLAFERAGL